LAKIGHQEQKEEVKATDQKKKKNNTPRKPKVEKIQDCDYEAHNFMKPEDLEAERETWEKSTLPREVQLRKPSADEKKLLRWVSGLLRREHGPPILCVVTAGQDFEDLKEKQDFKSDIQRQGTEKGPKTAPELKVQLVPRQFVAGGASVWVNFGCKNLWEKFAGALPFGAILLASGEILYSLMLNETQITTCSDIKNAQCLFFDDTTSIDFRHALGLRAAQGGCVCAFLSCLCLHVSNSIDNSPEDVNMRWCACLRKYVIAVCFHFKALYKIFFGWPCKIMRNRCCPSKDKNSDGEVEELQELEFPLLSTNE